MPTSSLVFLAACVQSTAFGPGTELFPSTYQSLDEHGACSAIAGDLVVIGAPNKKLTPTSGAGVGGAVVWRHSASGWQEEAILFDAFAHLEGGARVGESVAISGSTVALGAPRCNTFGLNNPGAVIVYDRDPSGAWTLTTRLTPASLVADDWLGFCVALDGDTLVAVARNDGQAAADAGAAYVFTRSGGVWALAQKLTTHDAQPSDSMWSCAIAGDALVLGVRDAPAVAFRSGAAYVYRRDASGVWQFEQKLMASDGGPQDRFGAAVSIDRDRLVVGAPEAGLNDVGTAYLFERGVGGAWSEVTRLVPAQFGTYPAFGAAVSMRRDRVLVGARGGTAQNPNGNGRVGAIHLFDRTAQGWGAAVIALATPPVRLGESSGSALGERFAVLAAPAAFQLVTGTAFVFPVEEVFATYCDPAVPTTAGTPGALAAHGSSYVSDNALRFECAGLPANVFGYLIAGDMFAFVPGAGGSFGDLCVGGTNLRFNDVVASSGATGSFARTLDLTNVPVVGAFAPGQVWNFQAWFRDGSRSNFSNAVQVTLR